MICKHCGREIPDGSNFCPYCGQSQQAQAPGAAPDPAREQESSRQSSQESEVLMSFSDGYVNTDGTDSGSSSWSDDLDETLQETPGGFWTRRRAIVAGGIAAAAIAAVCVGAVVTISPAMKVASLVRAGDGAKASEVYTQQIQGSPLRDRIAQSAVARASEEALSGYQSEQKDYQTVTRTLDAADQVQSLMGDQKKQEESAAALSSVSVAAVTGSSAVASAGATQEMAAAAGTTAPATPAAQALAQVQAAQAQRDEKNWESANAAAKAGRNAEAAKLYASISSQSEHYIAASRYAKELAPAADTAASATSTSASIAGTTAAESALTASTAGTSTAAKSEDSALQEEAKAAYQKVLSENQEGIENYTKNHPGAQGQVGCVDLDGNAVAELFFVTQEKKDASEFTLYTYTEGGIQELREESLAADSELTELYLNSYGGLVLAQKTGVDTSREVFFVEGSSLHVVKSENGEAKRLYLASRALTKGEDGFGVPMRGMDVATALKDPLTGAESVPELLGLSQSGSSASAAAAGTTASASTAASAKAAAPDLSAQLDAGSRKLYDEALQELQKSYKDKKISASCIALDGDSVPEVLLTYAGGGGAICSIAGGKVISIPLQGTITYGEKTGLIRDAVRAKGKGSDTFYRLGNGLFLATAQGSYTYDEKKPEAPIAAARWQNQSTDAAGYERAIEGVLPKEKALSAPAGTDLETFLAALAK